ncbi:MAG: hypothetical protein EP326_15555 [Deltaproteobacteria bacterium]|nr:MAG: hypothetical protein EP326_15555 [Deltaproteobacteria bacterium]TNF28764.1 MAG: hypothetical protein EP319_08415 [Deltaproteobacteria bacterium]
MKNCLLLLLMGATFISCGGNDQGNNLVVDNIDLTGVKNWKPIDDKIMKEVGESLEENSRELASVEITDKNVDVLTDYYLEYEVQKNDTLMLVAFKIYGDYRKWKDIKDWNENVVLGNKIKAGTKIYYKPTDNKFALPQGKAYLISRNETLGHISKKLYNKVRYWPFLYENNKRVVRDPSLIFPGFTLFYMDKKYYKGRKPSSVDTRPVFVQHEDQAVPATKNDLQ